MRNEKFLSADEGSSLSSCGSVYPTPVPVPMYHRYRCRSRYARYRSCVTCSPTLDRMVRFELTPRLRVALARARTLVSEKSEDAAALATAEREGSIALSEVTTVSRLLREHNDALSSPTWVHELLLGASPVLPAVAQRAPPHPSLAPRLAKLRAAEEDREYARMVGSIGKDEDSVNRDAAEMSTYRSQMGVGLNLIVSMATMFTVGAYACGTEEEPFGVRAVLCGLALMLIAMGVEMSLFLIGAIRTDQKVHKREMQARKGIADRTKLKSVNDRLEVAEANEKASSVKATGGGSELKQLRSLRHQ